MKGSEKKSSISSPPNDENFQTQKKQTVKGFMFPTVCAASKDSFPRKKVLGERNESPGSNSTITHFSKSSQKHSPSLDSKATSKDHYDPLKNCLSPRPRFLRYNPDRRKEILLRLEMEEKEGDDSTSESDEADSSSLASFSSQEDEESGDESESLLEEEDEEFDNEREEEIEEETTWSFRGVLKYFLLLVVLLLSTQYISSMNSTVSVPAFEGPALCFQNHSLGIANGFEIGYDFLVGRQEQLGCLSFTQTMADEVIEVEMTENANMGHEVEPEETVEEESITMVEAYEEEMEETEGENEVEKARGLKEDGEGENITEDELVKIELQEIEEAGEQIEENRDIIEEDMVEGIEQQETQTDEEIESVQEMEETEEGNEVEKARGLKEDGEGENITQDELVKIELHEIEEAGEQIEETRDIIEEDMVEDIEQQETQTDEEIESVQVDHQTSLLSEGTESLEEVPMEADEHIHKETSYTDMVQVLIMRIRSAVSMLEKWGNSLALKFQEMETEMFLKVVFGILAFAAIVPSSVFGSNISRKGVASKKDKRSAEPVAKEKKPSLPLPVVRDEPKKLAFSNATPLTTTSAVESRAPSVELLAEFEIGGLNRSLKNSATNSRMKDSVSKDQLGFSTVNSNSSEIWTPTAKKKLSGLSAVNSGSSERSTWTAKKKGSGKDLGSNDEVITPLRRSA